MWRATCIGAATRRARGTTRRGTARALPCAPRHPSALDRGTLVIPVNLRIIIAQPRVVAVSGGGRSRAEGVQSLGPAWSRRAGAPYDTGGWGPCGCVGGRLPAPGSCASVSWLACARRYVFSTSSWFILSISSAMRSFSTSTSSRTANIKWLLTRSWNKNKKDLQTTGFKELASLSPT